VDVWPDVESFTDHPSLPSVECSIDEDRDLNRMFIDKACIYELSRGKPVDCSGSGNVGANVALLIGLGDLKIYVSMKSIWWQLLYLIRIGIVPDDICGIETRGVIG
jgi:hypothetical protein